jgi:hypothetical protein
LPNKLQCEQPNEDKLAKDRCESLDSLIREQVIHALGTPIDLRLVQIRKVWDDHYRVNVIVGEHAGSVRIANSYFVVINGDGGLIASTPKITKLY